MSLKIFIFLLIFLIFIFKPSACVTERNNKKLSISTRIVGGYRVENDSLAKYMVSFRLQHQDKYHFGESHFCAGSIIAKNQILTAAHCVCRYVFNYMTCCDNFDIVVYLKASDYHHYVVVARTPKRLIRDKNTQELYIKKAYVHKNFNPDTMYNDIALLILNEDIKLDPQLASIISLPDREFEAGTECEVAGWGRMYENGPMANELLQTNLHLLPLKFCKKQFTEFSNKKVCASNIFDQDKDACVGDSGGPLICRGVLTGIVSYGYGCAIDVAGIYTNVYRFLDWINTAGTKVLKPSFLMIAINLMLVSVFKFM